MISLEQTISINPSNVIDKVAEKQRWKEYKNSWKSNEEEELNRLKTVLSEVSYTALQEIVDNSHNLQYTKAYFNEDPTRPLQGVLLGRALEIKNLYKDTHFTFIHGQKLGLWVVQQLIKELAKLKTSNHDSSLFHYFRSHEDGEKRNASFFANNENTNDYDFETRKKLLSVDGYFFHNYLGESANFFVRNNRNVFNHINSIISSVLLNECGVVEDTVLHRIIELVDNFHRIETIGNLYAICIPKQLVQEVVYSSHVGGVPCMCADSHTNLKVLQEHQNDEGLLASRCTFLRERSNCDYEFIQYRICTDMLSPEQSRVFLFSPVAKEIKDTYKIEIRKLAKAALDHK